MYHFILEKELPVIFNMVVYDGIIKMADNISNTHISKFYLNSYISLSSEEHNHLIEYLATVLGLRSTFTHNMCKKTKNWLAI